MKFISTLLLLIVLTTSLSSCALITNKQLKERCADSPYVYSDLSQGNTKQMYHLPNGTACPTEHGGILG